jgi:hypothetical protein
LPLEGGNSQETISSNIKETLESPTFAPEKSKKKRYLMAVAAAMRKAGKKKTVSQAAMQKKIR